MSVHEKMAFIRIIMRFQLIKVDGDRIFSILEKKRILSVKHGESSVMALTWMKVEVGH